MINTVATAQAGGRGKTYLQISIMMLEKIFKRSMEKMFLSSCRWEPPVISLP